MESLTGKIWFKIVKTKKPDDIVVFNVLPMVMMTLICIVTNRGLVKSFQGVIWPNFVHFCNISQNDQPQSTFIH